MSKLIQNIDWERKEQGIELFKGVERMTQEEATKARNELQWSIKVEDPDEQHPTMPGTLSKKSFSLSSQSMLNLNKSTKVITNDFLGYSKDLLFELMVFYEGVVNYWRSIPDPVRDTRRMTEQFLLLVIRASSQVYRNVQPFLLNQLLFLGAGAFIGIAVKNCGFIGNIFPNDNFAFIYLIL